MTQLGTLMTSPPLPPSPEGGGGGGVGIGLGKRGGKGVASRLSDVPHGAMSEWLKELDC